MMNTARLLRHERQRRSRTLVLNADFQPLTTWPLSLISAEDAVHAVYRDRVSVVENWEGAFYRSPSITIPVPKVVALREYAPVHGAPKFCRRSIFLRDRFRCQYCGRSFDGPDLTYDHVIPRSKGGRTEWENILTCCVDCNARKKSSDANYSGRKGVVGSDGRMRPLKQPKRPTAAELLRAGLEMLPNDLRDDFGSFLYWNVELER